MDFSPSLLAEDLKVLLDHLEIPKADLVAHSFGAKMAVRFAFRYSDRVRKVVIEDMEMIARTAYDEQIEKATLRAAEEVKNEIPMEFDTEKDLFQVFNSSNFYSENELIPDAGKVSTTPDGKFTIRYRPHAVYLYGYFCSIEDQTEDLKRLQASGTPILVLGADSEKSAISEAGKANFLQFNNVRIQSIPGATHNIHRTQKETFLSEVISFLRAE